MGVDISVRNLSKSFGKNRVLRNLSLDVRRSESFVILGGSGAGKSVFLKHLAHLLTPDEGEIFFDGDNLLTSSRKIQSAIINRVGILFQEIGLFDFMSVWENVAFHEIYGRKSNKKVARVNAIKNLADVGISELSANIYPSETSLGMQKRIGLARVLARDPDLVLLDEPTSGLDPILSKRIGNVVGKSIRLTNATAITITHDVQLATNIGDRIGLLHDGSFVWIGTREEFKNTTDLAIQQFKSGAIEGPLNIQDIPKQ